MLLTGHRLLLVGSASGLVLLHMAFRMIRHRSMADFQLFLIMALLTALFFMEVLFIRLPLLDVVLTIAMGVAAGLHFLRFIRFKK